MTIEVIRPDRPLAPGVQVVTTTRRGGVSRPPYDTLNLAQHVGDEPVAVQTNRDRVHRQLALPSAPCYLDQRHTDRVVYCGGVETWTTPVADALWTDRHHVVLAVMTADCLPIVLASAQGEVACVHAGWRGLANGIICATVRAMGTPAGVLHAWIGPGISTHRFEVGLEVRQQLLEAGRAVPEHFSPHPQPEKVWMDLKGIAAWQLAQCGVGAVEISPWCTAEAVEHFFSYRRDGVTGRMATYVWMERTR